LASKGDKRSERIGTQSYLRRKHYGKNIFLGGGIPFALTT
jgi:hypothetical protein